MGFLFYFDPIYSNKTKKNETYSVTHFYFLCLVTESIITY